MEQGQEEGWPSLPEVYRKINQIQRALDNLQSEVSDLKHLLKGNGEGLEDEVEEVKERVDEIASEAEFRRKFFFNLREWIMVALLVTSIAVTVWMGG